MITLKYDWLMMMSLGVLWSASFSYEFIMVYKIKPSVRASDFG